MLEALEALGLPASTWVVIGGKLSTSTEGLSKLRQSLLKRGFDGVFVGPSALMDFEIYLRCWGLLSPNLASKQSVTRAPNTFWLHLLTFFAVAAR